MMMMMIVIIVVIMSSFQKEQEQNADRGVPVWPAVPNSVSIQILTQLGRNDMLPGGTIKFIVSSVLQLVTATWRWHVFLVDINARAITYMR
jgi:hypothetical protein